MGGYFFSATLNPTFAPKIGCVCTPVGGLVSLGQNTYGEHEKPIPPPGAYIFYPPMQAYVVRVHCGSCWCAIKTSSDVWGNGFVGIATAK